MNERKQEGDEENALPAFAEDHLRAAVQVTLKDVLLKQGPEWDHQESPTPTGKIETGDNNDQRHRDECGKQQQLRRGEEVVNAKAELVRSLSVHAMRKDYEGERERDRNREYEFVCADESQDHPFSDQTRDDD